jgi:poly(3-hydroxybutyrate) depolymerase
MRKVVLACLIIALALACAGTLQADKKKTYKKMPSGTFTMKSKGGIEFVLAVPKGYNPKTGAPFLLCLHGDGRFNGINDIKGVWSTMTATGAGKGFVVCAPLASGQNWVGRIRDLTALIEELEDKYKFRIREYMVVGHSSGASVAYQIALSDTMRFSAFGSMGGRLQIDQEKVKKAGSIGAYLFHYANDKIVDPSHSTKAAEALKAAGATVEHKEEPGGGHAIDYCVPAASKTMIPWFAVWIKKKARALKDPGDDKNLAWASTLGFYNKLKEETKAGLVYLYSPKDKENKVAVWLRWDVFPDEEFKELAKEFVCAKVDYSNESYKEFTSELKIKKCTFLVIDEKKKILKKYTKPISLGKLLKDLKKYKEQMDKARKKKEK